jgi:hypothetical protein
MMLYLDNFAIYKFATARHKTNSKLRAAKINCKGEFHRESYSRNLGSPK